MKIYAHLAAAGADGTRVACELIALEANPETGDYPVPGQDIFTPAFAADMVDVTAVSPRPGQGWTTTDDGKAFQPPVAPPASPAYPRAATTYRLMLAFTDDQRAAYVGVKPWDQRLFSARDTPWPETNPKLARIADVLKTTPGAWFDAALNPPAA